MIALPLATVGMPVRNGADYIEQALASLVKQDHPSFEILVSDNGSTDDTVAIVRRIAAQHPRIRLIENRANVGALRNFNAVLAAARGPHFMWAAHDDLWEPSFLRRLAEKLVAVPQAAVAFCGFDHIDEQGRVFRRYPRIFELEAPAGFPTLSRYLLHHGMHGKVNLIYGLCRTDALRAAGGMQAIASRGWGDDLLVVFQILSQGSVTFVQDTLWHKRYTSTGEGSAKSPPPRNLRGRVQAIVKDYRDTMAYLNSYPPLINRAPGLTQAERHRLRSQVRTIKARHSVEKIVALAKGSVRRMFRLEPSPQTIPPRW